jgi:hypothetical protein
MSGFIVSNCKLLCTSVITNHMALGSKVLVNGFLDPPPNTLQIGRKMTPNNVFYLSNLLRFVTRVFSIIPISVYGTLVKERALNSRLALPCLLAVVLTPNPFGSLS